MLPYADLHIHSIHSDGTMTAGEILAAARAAGVGLLAIADHNMLAAVPEAQAACPDDILLLPAAELDSLLGQCDLHILAYGINDKDAAFRRFVARGRALLDLISTRLIDRMCADHPELSFEEYRAFRYDRTLGGWGAPYYLMEKGVCATFKEGLAFYRAYDCGYDCVPFPTTEEACAAIHAAGGKAVLAHPGESLPEGFSLDALLPLGIDGLECHYPTHTPEQTQRFLAFCRQHGLLITSGSDCHGSFFGGRGPIGMLKTPITALQLGGLLPLK